MTVIVSDSSTLCSKAQAREAGFTACPLSVQIGNESFVEYEELSSAQLLQKIKEGGVPTSSQPPVGDKIEAYNAFDPSQEIVDITMADGLSGTWQTACMAKDLCEHPENVTVINSRTLCGPHRALVKKAVAMAKDGKTAKQISDMVEKSLAHEISFLIPVDFGYLKRGGRVKGMEAGIGSMLKLVPVMKKTEDGTRLEKAAVCRTMKKAVGVVGDAFEEMGIEDGAIIYITHAFNEEAAMKAEELLQARFPQAKIVIYPLSPVFMTQGGPGCMAIQTIKIEE